MSLSLLHFRGFRASDEARTADFAHERTRATSGISAAVFALFDFRAIHLFSISAAVALDAFYIATNAIGEFFYCLVFHSLFPTPATPNHALHRTATAVTALATDPQTRRPVPRQPPRSLSLGSLGVSAPTL